MNRKCPGKIVHLAKNMKNDLPLPNIPEMRSKKMFRLCMFWTLTAHSHVFFCVERAHLF